MLNGEYKSDRFKKTSNLSELYIEQGRVYTGLTDRFVLYDLNPTGDIETPYWLPFMNKKAQTVTLL